jgi:NitT/TauT family transport system permease protein
VRLHYALLLPTPWSSVQALAKSVIDPVILLALLTTIRRVFIGFAVACAIGLPLGYLIGYSKTFLHFLDPLINSVRLVPIMAWVPLSIVWFGLGDGPTIFIITLASIFPIILNAVAGVQEISPDYYHAARSMGAGRWSIIGHVVIPASLPSILTGMRIGLGIGWMSVI